MNNGYPPDEPVGRAKEGSVALPSRGKSKNGDLGGQDV